MVRFVVLGLLVVAIIAGTVIGCGPRAQVAKDQILAKLDSVLGELDVKRKAIEIKQKELQSQLANVRERRIETEVRLEFVQKKKDAAQAAMDGMKGKLVKAQDLVEKAKEGGGTYTSEEGKTYSAEDIEKSARKVVTAFNKEKAKIDGLEASIKALQGSVEFLNAQESTSRDLMDKLAIKIDEIDSKKVAVDAVRDATSIGGDNKSMSESLAALEKEIDELSIGVETALRSEQSKLDDLASTNSAADELLTEPSNLDSISSELDAILNSGN